GGNGGESLGGGIFGMGKKGGGGQFGDDEQGANDNVETLQRQDVRMANGLDPMQGLEFLGDMRVVEAAAGQTAVNDLDRLQHSAGGLGFPDLAETALT